MKKKLNTDAVANELRHGSAFFRMDQPPESSTESDNPKPRYHNTTVSRNQDGFVETTRKSVKEFGKAEKKQPLKKRTPARANGRTTERPRERANARSLERSVPRIRVRSSFEMYQDQIAKLNELEINAKIKGEKFSKSDTVRKAIDRYFENLSD